MIFMQGKKGGGGHINLCMHIGKLCCTKGGVREEGQQKLCFTNGRVRRI